MNKHFAEDAFASYLYALNIRDKVVEKVSEVTVTHEQMEAIKHQRDDLKGDLGRVLGVADSPNIFVEHSKQINEMTTEQIVLAWHRHAKVKPKFVSFEEAKKAYEEGKHISVNFKSAVDRSECKESYHKKKLDYEGSISWYLITKGKWTIEEDN